MHTFGAAQWHELYVRVWSQFRAHVSFAELFHRKSAYGTKRILSELGAELGVDAADIGDPALVAAMRGDPVRSLGEIERILQDQGFTSFSYKVFPPHLGGDKLFAVLGMPGTSAVFVRRRFIDSYISAQKARAVGSWTQENTTDLTVSLDYDDFSRWLGQRRGWFAAARAHLEDNGLPFGTLIYEQDIDCPLEDHVAKAQGLFRQFGFDPAYDFAAARPKHTKQDRSSDYGRKVRNWTEFCDRAKAAGGYERLFQTE